MLKFEEYYKKVKGCYLGKMIGGTLGAPFECYRGVFNVDRYMQDVSSPVPNDDVDLQLVWLSAIEREGKRINSLVLAEYWNNYVSAVISEYGTGKNNFNMGILPPMSGYMRNINKDSNGAWIRTEIWACLCAGNPQLAANYAYYDACVDHADEGVYSAVFIAAIEAAAFFEKDTYKLIDIGLSYIPKDCAIAKAVKLAIDCYKSGKTWKEARIEMFKSFPSSFGCMGGYWKGTAEVPACKECPVQEPDSEIPEAVRGYDAPWAIGIIIVAWLYGEGDFGKSTCIAVNCGEDTDCTAGTLAAIMGIILGEDGIPDKWKKGCSDKIVTCTLRVDCRLNVPKNATELCDRIVKQTPHVLESRCRLTKDGSYTITPMPFFEYRPRSVDVSVQEDYADVSGCGHDTIRAHFRDLVALVKFDESLVGISENVEKKLTLTLRTDVYYPMYTTVRLIDFPEDWEMQNGCERCVGLEQWHGGYNDNKIEFVFTPHALRKGKYTVILEISVNGRLDKYYLPLTFINGACERRI